MGTHLRPDLPDGLRRRGIASWSGHSTSSASSMPRRARLVMPHVPLPITQRGVNRAAIFIDDEDRHHYRRRLREACLGNDIAIHAFVLMDNHVHLLLTPSRPQALAVAMRAVGQSYVQFFNYRHGRTGAVWQGRFKSHRLGSSPPLLIPTPSRPDAWKRWIKVRP